MNNSLKKNIFLLMSLSFVCSIDALVCEEGYVFDKTPLSIPSPSINETNITIPISLGFGSAKSEPVSSCELKYTEPACARIEAAGKQDDYSITQDRTLCVNRSTCNDLQLECRTILLTLDAKEATFQNISYSSCSAECCFHSLCNTITLNRWSSTPRPSPVPPFPILPSFPPRGATLPPPKTWSVTSAETSTVVIPDVDRRNPSDPHPNADVTSRPVLDPSTTPPTVSSGSEIIRLSPTSRSVSASAQASSSVSPKSTTVPKNSTHETDDSTTNGSNQLVAKTTIHKIFWIISVILLWK